MDIQPHEIHEWVVKFCLENQDEGYPVDLEDKTGVFYPREGELAVQQDVNNVKVKGEFQEDGGQERKEATATFRLEKIKEGVFEEELMSVD